MCSSLKISEDPIFCKFSAMVLIKMDEESTTALFDQDVMAEGC
jgi:hypothetical protein